MSHHSELRVTRRFTRLLAAHLIIAAVLLAPSAGRSQAAGEATCGSESDLLARIDSLYVTAVKQLGSNPDSAATPTCITRLREEIGALLRGAEQDTVRQRVLSRLESNLERLEPWVTARPTFPVLDTTRFSVTYRSRLDSLSSDNLRRGSLGRRIADRIHFQSYPAFLRLAYAADSIYREVHQNRQLVSVLLLYNEYLRLRDALAHTPPSASQSPGPTIFYLGGDTVVISSQRAVNIQIRTPNTARIPRRTRYVLQMSGLAQGTYGAGLLLQRHPTSSGQFGWLAGSQLLAASDSAGPRFGVEASVAVELLRREGYAGVELDIAPMVGVLCIERSTENPCGLSAAVLVLRVETMRVGIGRSRSQGFDVRVVYDF